MALLSALGVHVGLVIAAPFDHAFGALAFTKAFPAAIRSAITAAFTGRAVDLGALGALTTFIAFRSLTTTLAARWPGFATFYTAVMACI